MNFNGISGASPVIRQAFNVSSVTRNGTGDYTASFTTAMVDANYCYVFGGNNVIDGSSQGYFGAQGSRKTAPATTSFRVTSFTTDIGNAVDQLYVCFAIFR